MTLFVSPLKQFLNNLFNGSFVGFTSVESTVHQEILIQELSDAFDRGWDIPFGDIILSREGINLRDSIIPWSALRSFRLTKRELVIVRQMGNRFESHHVALRRISQLPIMLHLLETQAKVKMCQLMY
jgi:hypothetical protein